MHLKPTLLAIALMLPASQSVARCAIVADADAQVLDAVEIVLRAHKQKVRGTWRRPLRDNKSIAKARVYAFPFGTAEEDCTAARDKATKTQKEPVFAALTCDGITAYVLDPKGDKWRFAGPVVERVIGGLVCL